MSRDGQKDREILPGIPSGCPEGTARVGWKLTPKAWPNDARVAVCLSFDVDNELLQRANPLPVPLSVGEYGATTALPRILDLLDRHQLPATFFIPAMSMLLHPEIVPAILKSRRHEIGVHGWVHGLMRPRRRLTDNLKDLAILVAQTIFVTAPRGPAALCRQRGRIVQLSRVPPWRPQA